MNNLVRPMISLKMLSEVTFPGKCAEGRTVLHLLWSNRFKRMNHRTLQKCRSLPRVAGNNFPCHQNSPTPPLIYPFFEVDCFACVGHVVCGYSPLTCDSPCINSLVARSHRNRPRTTTAIRRKAISHRPAIVGPSNVTPNVRIPKNS